MHVTVTLRKDVFKLPLLSKLAGLAYRQLVNKVAAKLLSDIWHEDSELHHSCSIQLENFSVLLIKVERVSPTVLKGNLKVSRKLKIECFKLSNYAKMTNVRNY